MDLKKTLLHSLGIEVIKIEKGRVTATMPVDDRTCQPFGLLHGGASVALAETVASAGGYELVDKENEAVVGLEINANHIKGKKDGMVTAVGEVIHRGKATMIWEVKIKDEQDQLICISRCTLAIIKIKK
ncbi:hotdog fold thioesterase [Niallia endozanthoxylica]|uniref:Hotdog fold thioesterase n=1 Tax=Niallia endozanthoxylica TaxID=2036016 RepID=A0A5J5HGR8_9BACI|nr:hotdog fold thioesterase [Niallia endozanthoxylica]KAA9019949.1 hotdog fold thioesterase [Niallia endozanthoxylica]